MISIDDYTDASGKLDFAAYRKAEVAAGETCRRCGSLVFPPAGKPTLCHDCRKLESANEPVEHQRMVRCPHCRRCWEPDWEDRVHQEGENTIWCSACNSDFTVNTRVEYYYTSPAVTEKQS